MGRRQELEKIIIGTLLDCTEDENYFVDCRCCVTEEMMTDEVNRRIFHLISEMNEKGKTMTDPLGIFNEYGQQVADLVPVMCELVTDYSFKYKKAMLNEGAWLRSEYMGADFNPSCVEFSDYVNGFIKYVFHEEGKGDKAA